MFPNKNWSLGGLEALMQKMTTQVLLFAVVGSGRPRIVCAVPVLSIFLISAFSPSRLQFLVGDSLSNRFAPYFLFSRKYLIKYCCRRFSHMLQAKQPSTYGSSNAMASEMILFADNLRYHDICGCHISLQ